MKKLYFDNTYNLDCKNKIDYYTILNETAVSIPSMLSVTTESGRVIKISKKINSYSNEYEDIQIYKN